jgi:CheY-like chemotaxis protein
MTIIMEAENHYFCFTFYRIACFYCAYYYHRELQQYPRYDSSPPYDSFQNHVTNAAPIAAKGHTKEPAAAFLKKILIVDDDPDITLALKTVLEDNGYSVYAFNDPMDAVSNFKRAGMYDLLIVDIVMPNMDGFEFYEKVKKIDNNVKACFITAYDVRFEALRELYPDFEIDCFMKKPIENEDLLRKVMNSTTILHSPSYDED